ARRALLGALKIVEGDRARTAITDETLDRMLVSADRLLRIAGRLSAEAQAARTLVVDDRHPAADRTELLARMTRWKALARGGGPQTAPGSAGRARARGRPAPRAPRRPTAATSGSTTACTRCGTATPRRTSRPTRAGARRPRRGPTSTRACKSSSGRSPGARAA